MASPKEHVKRADRKKLGITNNPELPKLSPIQQLVQDYQTTFSSPSGEAVLKDLRDRFQKRRSFVPDSNATAFHEGQRDIVRMIENFLEADVAAVDNLPEETTSA